MIVETLAVGTELLLGQIVNSNASTIGAKLADAGLDHYHQAVVGDNLERIAGALRLALGRSDAVIVTGGIGPTQDDVTREAICAALDLPMLFDDDYAGRLRRWWERRGREMPDSNLRQAQHPEGAELIINRKGTAPGLRVPAGGKWVFAVPGVPAEMEPMLDEEIIPFLLRLDGDQGSVVKSRILRSWGESESRIGEMLGDLFEETSNPTMAFLASSGEIKVRLTAKARSEGEAEALIAPVEAEVRRRLGTRIFGADDETIEKVLLNLIGDRGWTLGTAESATGGMIAARITSVPGASKVFAGSVVAYDERVKRRVLGVTESTLAGAGAVSEEVALEMAEGGARALGADVVIAITGSAGPDPQGRPVGTMIAAVRTPIEARARTLALPGDRERVRTFTTTAALHLCRLAVTEAWWREGSDNWGKVPRSSP